MTNDTQRPLVVDLDGTLINTDTLMESLMLFLKVNPLRIFLLFVWVLKGKAYFKHQVAERVDLNVASLPYNDAVLDLIRSARDAGRPCYLATGAVHKYADAIAEYTGLFDGVYATDSATSVNFTGKDKAEGLIRQFGEFEFDYVGNSSVDLRVWNHSHTAYVVSASSSLSARAADVSKHVVKLDAPKRTLKTWIKGIRVHQWVKNSLIAIPLFTSHQFLDVELLSLVALGILAFSLAASSVYVLNDLLDLESDRQHPSKCKRPFASGAIPVHYGLALFPVLLFSAFVISLFLPLPFVAALGLYYLLTVAYSFKLKQVILLDTIVLAALYTMRIVAGTLLINVAFSFWLLAFSVFIFLSLALVKRYTELVLMMAKGETKTIGRGYHGTDAPIVAAFGCAAGYIAVMVLALYVNSAEVLELYSNPSLLWLACLVMLYWISRVWMLAHRGQMHDDPIVFAVKDMQSLVTGIVVASVFFLAT
ncbi:Decaprenyl-phosphate phosphoribosyltransferase [BD1-7 clade bacterium]|uniref:Decaprenyl-phosphate phosphoribosyltransferase n=1 Tax=BD1-7 clade bacterium TaxID=2029982 RepID=A0A5S9N4I3_9GAMM|nr:Decaprenyl-phosphate phosphoribosyltransferase [BD1-7 clade bacterium]